ncbi:hypothetical protein GCM10022259_26220 [Aquimarina mytili]
MSQEEKELLVKQTIIEFNKSAIETGKFQQFMKSRYQKTATDTSSESVNQDLFEEFLGEQSQAFLDLYYQLEAMNMTGEEFRRIADQYEYLRIEIRNSLGKSSSAGCDLGSLWCAIEDWVSQKEQATN